MNGNNRDMGIGIAGLGTVGATVARLILERSDKLAASTGQNMWLRAVSARDRTRDRGVDLSLARWCDDPVEIARRTDVDLVIELIGGSDGPALALAKEALSRGKALVTANKAMIAAHGQTLAALAEEHGGVLRFEAAVAGGIPILKALGEGLAANEVEKVSGILNGTCNYILSRMEAEGADFAAVLKDAQSLGYAESDPTFDVNGMDTAHKTVILSALAFGVAPSLEHLDVEGIESIAPVDIDYAKALGYRIRLLGVTDRSAAGISVRVHPAMVSSESALASVTGPTNAVMVEADPVGPTVYEGAGAGGGPTASAVLADVVDIARGVRSPAFGVPAQMLERRAPLAQGTLTLKAYLRLRVSDEPGVMAEISQIFAKSGVSIESLIQRGAAEGGGVYVVMTTHRAVEDDVVGVLDRLKAAESVLETPTMIRIEAA